MSSPPAESSSPAPIRVFLLDDHELVRRGIRTLLESEGDIVVVGESERTAGAARTIIDLAPDVAILDVRLPDGSGVDVCREVRSAAPAVRAVMLTSYDDDEALFAAIIAGAAGYVLKQVRGTDFVHTVRRVAAGQSMVDPALTTQVLARVRVGPSRDVVFDLLTRQEQLILQLVAEGLTNRQIGVRINRAERTVKNYVTAILVKLGLSSRTQAAVYAATRTRT